MPARNMSAPPRMVYTCKPVVAQAPALNLDPTDARSLRTFARVSVPGLLFGLLGEHAPELWQRLRNTELTVAAVRSRELRDELVTSRLWQRWLMVLAEALCEGRDGAAALEQPLDYLVDLPAVEARTLAAAGRLPSDSLPPFAVVRAAPTELIYTQPSALDPALALALLVRTGGTVFSRSRAPALPTVQCLDVCYEYSAYGAADLEVLSCHTAGN